MKPETRHSGTGPGKSRRPLDPEALKLTRQINEVGYKAIRSTSGANTTRIIMVMPKRSGQINRCWMTFIPIRIVYRETEGIVFSRRRYIHTIRGRFAGQNGTNSAWPGIAAIESSIVRRGETMREKLGIEVNYGEFGVGRDKDPESRNANVVRDYYHIVRRTTARLGMSSNRLG